MNGDSMGWTEVSLPDSRAVELAIELDRTPISMHWIEFDSTDSEEFEALMQLVTRPLDHLVGQLPDVSEDWHVVTTLNNHHRRLNPRIHFLAATVAPDEMTVYLTTTKQNEDLVSTT